MRVAEVSTSLKRSNFAPVADQYRPIAVLVLLTRNCGEFLRAQLRVFFALAFRNYQRFHFGRRIQFFEPATINHSHFPEFKNPILLSHIELVTMNQKELLLIPFPCVEKFVVGKDHPSPRIMKKLNLAER